MKNIDMSKIDIINYSKLLSDVETKSREYVAQIDNLIDWYSSNVKDSNVSYSKLEFGRDTKIIRDNAA